MQGSERCARALGRVGGVGLSEHYLWPHFHDSVDFAVHPLYALEMRLNDLARRRLPAPNELRQRRG